jgi:hypothetical protein
MGREDLPDGVAQTITPIASATTYTLAQFKTDMSGGPTPCSSNIEYIPKLTTGIAINQLSSLYEEIKSIGVTENGDIPQQQYFGSINDFPKSLYIDFMVVSRLWSLQFLVNMYPDRCNFLLMLGLYRRDPA